jgi:two-component system chemotaxis sensor kinase CheA
MERLPVILVTSLATPADRARGAESGANGYVVKSDFDPEAFVQMVREELGAEDWI